jgi:hypothetical protein
VEESKRKAIEIGLKTARQDSERLRARVRQLESDAKRQKEAMQREKKDKERMEEERNEAFCKAKKLQLQKHILDSRVWDVDASVFASTKAEPCSDSSYYSDSEEKTSSAEEEVAKPMNMNSTERNVSNIAGDDAQTQLVRERAAARAMSPSPEDSDSDTNSKTQQVASSTAPQQSTPTTKSADPAQSTSPLPTATQERRVVAPQPPKATQAAPASAAAAVHQPKAHPPCDTPAGKKEAASVANLEARPGSPPQAPSASADTVAAPSAHTSERSRPTAAMSPNIRRVWPHIHHHIPSLANQFSLHYPSLKARYPCLISFFCRSSRGALMTSTHSLT